LTGTSGSVGDLGGRPPRSTRPFAFARRALMLIQDWAGPLSGPGTSGVRARVPGVAPHRIEGVRLDKEISMASPRRLEDRFAFAFHAVQLHRLRRRPVLEVLEDRVVLATLTVNGLGDAGSESAATPVKTRNSFSLVSPLLRR
jgi:hypothetical protein